MVTPDYDLDEHLKESNRFLHDKVEMSTTTKTKSQLNLHVVQEIRNAHSDSIWVAKFSPCGKYLATGGKDACLKVWRVKGSKQTEEEEEEGNDEKKEDEDSFAPMQRMHARKIKPDLTLFEAEPAWEFREHAHDIVDLSWNDAHLDPKR